MQATMLLTIENSMFRLHPDTTSNVNNTLNEMHMNKFKQSDVPNTISSITTFLKQTYTQQCSSYRLPEFENCNKQQKEVITGAWHKAIEFLDKAVQRPRASDYDPDTTPIATPYLDLLRKLMANDEKALARAVMILKKIATGLLGHVPPFFCFQYFKDRDTYPENAAHCDDHATVAVSRPVERATLRKKHALLTPKDIGNDHLKVRRHGHASLVLCDQAFVQVLKKTGWKPYHYLASTLIHECSHYFAGTLDFQYAARSHDFKDAVSGCEQLGEASDFKASDALSKLVMTDEAYKLKLIGKELLRVDESVRFNNYSRPYNADAYGCLFILAAANA